MNATYNPILEVRILRRFRLAVRDLRPTMNTALVLVPDAGDPLVIRSGEIVPQIRTANYRELYVIDTSDHLLQLECRLPSSESAFAFHTVISYRCMVSDPAFVVKNSYTDAGAVLAPLLTRVLRATTRGFDPAEAGQAEGMANHDLRDLRFGLGFSVSDCVVELALDGDEAGYKRKLRNTRHTVEVEQAELEHVMPYVEAGDVGMLALFIAKHREHAGAVVDLLMERDHQRGAQLIEAMKVVFAKSTPDDDFDIESARTRIVRQVVDEMSGERSSGPALSLSRGRLRGTLLGATAHDDAPRELPPPTGTRGEGSVRPAAADSPRPSDNGEDRDAPADPDAGA